jgi:hypothetical protein
VNRANSAPPPAAATSQTTGARSFAPLAGVRPSSEDGPRTELFAACDVALTGRRESLIAALSTTASSEDLRRHVSLPQNPSPTRARRRFVRCADAHTGARPGGARGRRSSAGCPARGRRARDAPAPPDPGREDARCPETGCRWTAWRGQADPRGGRAPSDTPSTSRLPRARTASIARSLTSGRDGATRRPVLVSWVRPQPTR